MDNVTRDNRTGVIVEIDERRVTDFDAILWPPGAKICEQDAILGRHRLARGRGVNAGCEGVERAPFILCDMRVLHVLPDVRCRTNACRYPS